MIRLAHWEHASHLHFAVFFVAAVLFLFTSFIGVLCLLRAVVHRRGRAVTALRRTLGTAPGDGLR